MTTLFSLPIPTGGTFVCSNPPPSTKEGGIEKTIYILTFTSPPDNRLTPAFIDVFVLALDIIEHRFPKGVVVTTSGIGKFFSNGLDLEKAASEETFLPRWLWRLFRRVLTYPMPTVALLNGHAFAGGLMLALFHDYRIQNPSRGFLCLNEIEFGVVLQPPMMSIFREKTSPSTFRSLVLEGKRFPGPESLAAGLVDALGALDETLKFVKERKLVEKTASGIYGAMKEEMYRETLGFLDDHDGNIAWREKVETAKDARSEEAEVAVKRWEEESRARKTKL